MHRRGRPTDRADLSSRGSVQMCLVCVPTLRMEVQRPLTHCDVPSESRIDLVGLTGLEPAMVLAGRCLPQAQMQDVT